ncbi:GDYXXLXY domain-containing protein [Methanosarcina sp. UBA411]|uniref:GDYXXLXY domain-containing protein n=1 Tax=Methanosarcina sp. UBA411 TaxID=1915589 RepID=UPI0025DF080C|nr:GDYXXLXY domain-containing protein [Methanosarcina sp. UBA411]
MNQKKVLYLTLVFWLLIFSGFIAYKEYTLRTGTEVMLKTLPVDPRDLFRGDYVTLNYEISTLDMEKFHAENSDFYYDEPVYLTLKLENGYGIPKEIYTTPPEDELYIKGKVKGVIYDWETDESSNMTEEATIKELRVDYGIESYFVPEGRGMEIEKAQQTGKTKVDAKVIIDKYGNAVIKSLLIDGK